MDDEVARPVALGLLPGASYALAPVQCATRRFTTELVPSLVPVYTHAECTCNEERALKYRHLVDTGSRCTAASEVFSVLAPLAARLRKTADLRRLSALEYIDGYSGNKRSLLQQARVSLQASRVSKRDAAVRMFLKDDKYVDGEFKEPRCIQYRSKRYHLRLGSYLAPIEHAFYGVLGPAGVPVCAKARNTFDRAADLRVMWDAHNSPVAILLDHSKFDAHVSPELLRVEHAFYSLLVPEEKLARLLEMQRVNRGRTATGTSYSVKATRMSGDVNTGLGNSVLNYGMIRAWLDAYGVSADVYVDGDDSVVVMSRVDLHLVDPTTFARFGMETKVDYAYQFEEVDFCQCRPVETVSGWRMVRNPTRVVSRAPWTTRQYPEVAYLRLIRTIGWCELACNGGVPILQAYAKWFMAQGAGRLMRHEISERLRGTREVITDVPITMFVRQSFADAWGISPAEQVRIEQSADWAALL